MKQGQRTFNLSLLDFVLRLLLFSHFELTWKNSKPTIGVENYIATNVLIVATHMNAETQFYFAFIIIFGEII